ncbi:hypothetical protein C8R44DRAFT_859038 [Mycena epipterygia]|nr:hypothetical protein C8R44DRAFT_859038 [Mycena epipterygia]
MLQKTRMDNGPKISSMTVKELQAYIEEVSSDIEGQKDLEALKKLRQDKNAAQRQLNAILDPVARLPFELSSEIFQCLYDIFPYFPTPNASKCPMLLLNISHAWTQIALATPALWADLKIDRRSANFIKLLRIWLERAHNCPLSISIDNTTDNRHNDLFSDVDVTTLIRQYAHHLQNLDLVILCVNNNPDLSTWTESSYPFLTTLAIYAFGNPPFSSTAIRKFLNLAPNLVECNFQRVEFADGNAIGTLVHTSLRHLTFGAPLSVGTGDIDSGDGILKNITLPGLQSLALSMMDIFTVDLVQFLQRSSPPLQKLTLDTNYNLDLSHLGAYLHLLPTLTHFALQLGGGTDPYPPDTFFDELARNLSGSLPNLHTLMVRIIDVVISQASYETLVQALSARRPRIACLKLIWPGVYSHDAKASVSELRPDIYASFRQLVTDGMEIQFGDSWHESKNYFC